MDILCNGLLYCCLNFVYAISEDQGWKQKLKLPPKDLRIKTAVKSLSLCLVVFAAVAILCNLIVH